MYIKLFTCCAVVEGAGRASIIDIQREEIFFIPLSLSGLIDKEIYAINILQIKERLDESSIPVLDEYIAFLIDNELGFYCDEDELSLFPKMSEEYLYPATISNCIIDSNGDNLKFFDSSFFSQLEILCCNHIQLRLFTTIDFNSLDVFLNLINNNQIKSLEIIIPANEYLMEENNVIHILENNRKLRALIITSSDYNKVLDADEFSGTAILTGEKISDNLHCGIVQLNQFSINVSHYTESLHYNSCLNRKMGIDVDGNIKNCPSMKESFGNVTHTTLVEAFEKPGFKKYWNITKDHIDKCRDCEFRHVCTDCRAYTDDPGNPYSAPLKCGYDPYSCIWEEWSANPLKKKGILYYGMQDLASIV